MNGFPGGKGRFCLVVALEASFSSMLPARAHYVAGSTKTGSKPELVLEVGEAGLDKVGYFSFFWSGDIGVTTLGIVGRLKGRVDSSRHAEIKAAICASRRLALRKLVTC
jgi:hypothetical protein